MKMHEGVDNRLAMLAALKTFGVPIHCEGLCGQCGLRQRDLGAGVSGEHQHAQAAGARLLGSRE